MSTYIIGWLKSVVRLRLYHTIYRCKSGIIVNAEGHLDFDLPDRGAAGGAARVGPQPLLEALRVEEVLLGTSQSTYLFSFHYVGEANRTERLIVDRSWFCHLSHGSSTHRLLLVGFVICTLLMMSSFIPLPALLVDEKGDGDGKEYDGKQDHEELP